MMVRITSAFVALWGLGQCSGDETISAYGGANAIWEIAEIDGAPFPYPATLVLPEEGQLSGNAPCNSYSGEQTAPYPWFEPRAIRSTRRACPDLKAENTYLKALQDMTLAEIAGSTLILSNTSGREMLFHAKP